MQANTLYFSKHTPNFRPHSLSSYLIYYSGIWLGSRQQTMTLPTVTIQMCLFTKENEQLSDLSMSWCSLRSVHYAACSVKLNKESSGRFLCRWKASRHGASRDPKMIDCSWQYFLQHSRLEKITSWLIVTGWLFIHTGAKTRLEQNSNSFITYYK